MKNSGILFSHIMLLILPALLASSLAFSWADPKQNCTLNEPNSYCYTPGSFDEYGQHKTCITPGQVALTFDDGPDPVKTLAVLNILDKYAAKATFFLIGRNLQANPAMAKTILDRGHQIGNHGYTHMLLNDIGYNETVAEIYRFEQVFKAANLKPGVVPRYYRIRSGHLTDNAKQVVTSFGLTPVHWAMNNEDSDGLDVNQIKALWDSHFKPTKTVDGSKLVTILQMHDRQQATVDSLDYILNLLTTLQKKPNFVKLEQCLGKSAYLPIVPRDVPADPTCSLGVPSADKLTCCTTKCGGVCGGSTCGTLFPLSSKECCPTAIKEAGFLCNNSIAPCILEPTVVVPVPDPTCANGITKIGTTYCCDSRCGVCGGIRF